MSNTRRQHYQNHRLRLGTEIWSLRWSPNSVWYTRVHGTRGRELWPCVASNGHVEHRGHMLCAVSVPFQSTNIYISNILEVLYKFTWKLYKKTVHAWNSIQFLIGTSKDDFRRLIKYIVFSKETLNIPRLSLLKQWSLTFWIKIGSTLSLIKHSI